MSKPSVLFVCIENSNRSQMAGAFARLHGGDKVEAHSAGSQPSGNPRAVQFMAEKGTTSRPTPRSRWSRSTGRTSRLQ